MENIKTKKNNKTISLSNVHFEILINIPKSYKGESGYHEDYIMYNDILDHSPNPDSLIKSIRKLITSWVEEDSEVKVIQDCF